MGAAHTAVGGAYEYGMMALSLALCVHTLQNRKEGLKRCKNRKKLSKKLSISSET
jgi:hypothetical protein